MNTTEIYNRAKFDEDTDMAARRLRRIQIFYHKDITKEQAERLFDEAIDPDKATRIVTPDLTEWVNDLDGVRKSTLNK